MSLRDLFLELTPDWVVRAVEDIGLEPTGHCMALHCMENRVYSLMLEDKSHVVAKFYRPGRWTKEAIQEEHDFLLQLQENDVPVCAPLQFDGQTLFEIEGIYYAVWPRTGGRSPSELDAEQARMLGRLVARIHNVGASRSAEHRLTMNSETYIRKPAAFLQEGGFIDGAWRERYGSVANNIADVYDRLSEGVPTHRIHGDCHLANVLHGKDGWFFLDFDDFLTGPAAQDMWLVIPGNDLESVALRKEMSEAYMQFRDFMPRWMNLVEPLRAMRIVHYSGWLGRRWHDPAFPNAFPQFTEEAYWQRETQDLENLLRLISSPEYMTPNQQWM